MCFANMDNNYHICKYNGENNKIRQVTRGIKHWGLNGYANRLPRIKFGVSGQESSPHSPTISYRHR